MSQSLLPAFRKMNQTPMRDLVRLRLTGRLDWKGHLAAESLPASIKGLIVRVVQLTRLFRLEKAAVAAELSAHFLDGIAKGSNCQELISGFGDARLAAKLIRRAKRRGRPLAWQIWNWVFRIGATVFGIYLICLIRYFVSRPTVSVDYIAVLNEPVLHTAESDRAWPLWKKAILESTDGAKDQNGNLIFPAACKDQFKGNNTITLAQREKWFTQHAAAVIAARAAGLKPTLGFIIGSHGSADDTQLFPAWTEQQLGDRSDPLIAILLPHLNYLRTMGEILCIDAKFAASRGDGVAVEADMISVLGLCRQLFEADGIYVTQLVAISIKNMANDQLQHILRDHPEVLHDDQLIRLAHAIAGPKVAADLLNLKGERYFFDDIVQRTYTDNGHGNGHITFDGATHTAQMIVVAGNNFSLDQNVFELTSTVPLLTASRAELMSEYNRLMDQSDADFHLPLRLVDLDGIDSEMQQIQQSDLERTRYTILLRMIPRLIRAQATCERLLGYRDGTLVAIGLELYRRHNGNYPPSLDELVPLYVPAIPADRITGDPVKYRLIDGKPVVYSVGVDRIDDGGKRPMRQPYTQSEPAQWEKRRVVPKGDWVLYPPDPADGD